MKEVSALTVLVIDYGLFLPFARRMAEEAKRVIFHNPDRRSYPSIKQACIGDGFKDLEHTLDYWPLLKEIDLVCIPDVGHAGLQQHFEDLGIPVWGSRFGDKLELARKFFLETIEKLGLEVPEYTALTGLDALEAHLKGKDDHYIKISRYRGDMETKHWRSYEVDKPWLDWMRVNLGPYQNLMPFLVFPAIKTPLEIGGDGIAVNGKWPSLMLNGIEHKDTTYFSVVTKTSEMPDVIKEIMEAVSPILKDCRYRNQISFEVRVKDKKGFWIDATQRAGMPSSASQQLLWKNFPAMVWGGANGMIVEPVPAGKFSIECMITCKSSSHDTWDVVTLPADLHRWARMSHCGFVNNAYAFPPDEFHSSELGWLCVIGDTPRETLQKAKDMADQLPDGLDANLENLTGLIKEIDEAGKQDISFTEQTLPEPAEVIDD